MTQPLRPDQYETFEAMILSDQIPLHELAALFADNPDFIAALQQGWPFPVHPRSYEASLVDQVASLFDEGQG